METDRRTVLAGLAGGGIAAALGGPAWAKTAADRTPGPLYLGARADGTNGFRVSGFDTRGAIRFDLPIPSRGHDFAVHPNRRLAVLVARRPDRWFVVLDLEKRAIVRTVHSRDDRHYYGHGVFAADGRLLYLPENDFGARRGVLGVYDARDGFRRVGELPSHGIGPHEVRLLSDGRTLVAANGGVATDPSAPRVKLNVPTMEPSVTFVDRTDGRLLHKVGLPKSMHMLGIRHLAVNRDDEVAIAMQYEGPRADVVPLVGTCSRGAREARLFEQPRAPIDAMRLYTGAIVFDAGGTLVCASSPRGGAQTVWEAATGRHVATYRIADTCGVAPATRAGHFIASDGRGRLWILDAAKGEQRPIPVHLAGRPAWDNHLARV